MQIVSDSLGYSFKKVTNLVAKGFVEQGYRRIDVIDIRFPYGLNPLDKHLVIGDTVITLLMNNRIPSRKKVLWVDSPLEVLDERNNIDESTCIYTAHPFWAKYYKAIGLDVYGWIPRPVDFPTAVKTLTVSCEDLRRIYGEYVITVANDHVIAPPRIPRKGLDAFDQVCEWLRKRNINCLAITNWRLKNAYTIKTFTLLEHDLLRYIKCAKIFLWLSRGEGFGMPPIEAMAVRTLVVSSNAEFNSHVVGVKFEYESIEKVYMPETGRNYIAWIYDIRKVIDAVDYALSLSDDEREEIVNNAFEQSKLYDYRLVSKILNEVI